MSKIVKLWRDWRGMLWKLPVVIAMDVAVWSLLGAMSGYIVLRRVYRKHFKEQG